MNDEQLGIEPEDEEVVEGHKQNPGRGTDDDDVEGHRQNPGRVSPHDDDDVEGHRQNPGR